MSYQHILVPVDGSKISFSAVEQAAAIAKAFNCQVTAISVVAEDPFSGADFYYSSVAIKDYLIQAYENAEKTLEQAKELAQKQGVTLNTEIIKGYVSADTINETAEDKKVDLIVMGSHGRQGFQKFFLGSFALDVLAQTVIPVLIIKE
ncbi:universal stress protein [Acinetobacter stercoris]|uniref:Universal stress protein n=1 Tax=Acinetobacter stercoris TaxID=2126983 RepID=A0A2U3N1A5_9GAMM|nr:MULTISPECIES: universal stress protein [Acinetobacter]SPL71460.1 putative universal stress protein [Acinetobacter stercoris]